MLPSDLFEIDGQSSASSPGLLPGRVYAVVLCDDAYAAPLAWGALLAAAAHGRPAWCIANDDAVKFLSTGNDLAQEACAAVAGGTVRILQSADRRASTSEPDLGLRVLEEFTHFGISHGALVVLDCAERLLGQAALSAAALLHWRNWAESGEQSLLLIFRQDAEAMDQSAELMPHAALLGGIARLRSSDGAPSWEIFHWFGLAGAIAGRTLDLTLDASGRILGRAAAAPDAGLEPAADVDVVYCMKGVLAGGHAAPAHWLMVDNLDTMLSRASAALAATVILCFDRSVEFDVLARAVFTLRQSCGKRLKIVVREIERQRYSQEGLVMRLGANLTVPPEVTYSRFLSMVTMTQDQVFSRALPADYASAVADMLPDQRKGYLPPLEFVRAVRLAMESGRLLGVQSIVIRLPISEGLHALDALSHCTVSRAGDLYSSDLTCVYLFLFACQESDASIAVGRLFRLPVSTLFHSEEHYFSAQTMRVAIGDLAARANGDSLPDLTQQLAALGTEPARAAPINAPLRMNDLRHDAPLPARPHRLKLRLPPTPATIAS